MDKAAAMFGDLRGWRRAFGTFFIGALSDLAMAPFFIWPVLFVTLTALVWLLDGDYCHGTDNKPRWRRAALTGWWFGFGYFFAGLYWIGGAFLVDAKVFIWLLPFAISLLPAGLALFMALACAGAMMFWGPGIRRIAAVALALGLGEWLRGHILTGFPWNLLGNGLTANDALLQLASLIGIYGLSVLAVLIFAMPASLYGRIELRGAKQSGLISMCLTMLVLFGGWSWGTWRLASTATTMVPGVKLRLVQPNISQVEKWDPAQRADIIKTHLDLSAQKSVAAPRGLQDVTHLIWPEVALPLLLARSKDVLKRIDDLLPDGTILLTGALRLEIDPRNDSQPSVRRFYNGLVVLDDRAKISTIYNKKHLVPFGEYLPMQSWLEAMGLRQLTKLRGGFSSGTGPRLLSVPGAPDVGPLICYEVIFSGEITNKLNRPGWLLNLTNDGWYGVSTGPYQHLHQARVRAVEEGLPMVRVANTGVSAVIDALGRPLKKTRPRNNRNY